MRLKKAIFILLFVLVMCFSTISGGGTVYAEDQKTKDELEQEIESNVNDLLKEFDFSAIDKLLMKLTEDQQSFFGAKSFMSKIKQLITGEFANGYSSLPSALLSLFFDSLINFIPVFAIIIAIAVLSSLFGSVSSNNKGIADIIHLVCFGVIAVIIVKYVLSFVSGTLQILSALTSISEIIFPVLLTLLSTMGAVVSASVYQPAVLLLTNYILKMFSTVLISLFIFSFVFTILSSVSSKVKFSKFSEFFSGIFKWLIGFIFTIFMAYLALQGITAGTRDGMSIRTAKYAMRSYVPFLGGYLSEGLDLILSSMVLIKNAVGVSGILLILGIVIVPVLQIAIFSLGLKLVAAISQPIADDRIVNFVSGVAKLMNYLVAIICGAVFMFLITIGLMILTTNSF